MPESLFSRGAEIYGNRVTAQEGAIDIDFTGIS
jgi:hypothetical protein